MRESQPLRTLIRLSIINSNFEVEISWISRTVSSTVFINKQGTKEPDSFLIKNLCFMLISEILSFVAQFKMFEASN